MTTVNDGGDRDELPLTRSEINELAFELRLARADLTRQLNQVLELSNRLTDLVVRLLREVH